MSEEPEISMATRSTGTSPRHVLITNPAASVDAVSVGSPDKTIASRENADIQRSDDDNTFARDTASRSVQPLYQGQGLDTNDPQSRLRDRRIMVENITHFLNSPRRVRPSNTDTDTDADTNWLKDLDNQIQSIRIAQTDADQIQAEAEASRSFEQALHKLYHEFSSLTKSYESVYESVGKEYRKQIKYSNRQDSIIEYFPSLLKELDDRSADNNDKEQRIIDLTDENEVLVGRNQSLQDHNSRLEQQVRDLTMQINQLRSFEKRYYQLSDTSQVVRTELESKLAETRSELVMSKNQNEDLEKELSDTGHFLEHACNMNDLLSMDLDRYISQAKDTSDTASQVRSISETTRSMVAPGDALSKIQELTTALSQSSTSSNRNSYELTIIDAIDAGPTSLNASEHHTDTTPLQKSHSIVSTDSMSDANLNPVQTTENSPDAVSQSITQRIYEDTSSQREQPHPEEDQETNLGSTTSSNSFGSYQTAPRRTSNSTDSEASTARPTSPAGSQPPLPSTRAADHNPELGSGTRRLSSQDSTAENLRETIVSQGQRPPPRNIRPSSAGALSSRGSSISPNTVSLAKRGTSQAVSDPAVARQWDMQGQILRRPESLPTDLRDPRPPQHNSYSNSKTARRSGIISRRHQQTIDQTERSLDHDIQDIPGPAAILLPSPTGSTDSDLDNMSEVLAVKHSPQSSRSVAADQDQPHQDTFHQHQRSDRGSLRKSKPLPLSLDTVEANSDRGSLQPPTASTNASVGVMLSRAIDSLEEDGELKLTNRDKCIQYLRDNDLTSRPRSQALTNPKGKVAGPSAPGPDQLRRSSSQGETVMDRAVSEPVDSNIQRSIATPRRFSESLDRSSRRSPSGRNLDLTTRQYGVITGQLSDGPMTRQSKSSPNQSLSDHWWSDSLQDGSSARSPTRQSDAVESRVSEHDNTDMQSGPQYRRPRDNSGDRTHFNRIVSSRKSRIAFLGVIGPMSTEARQLLDAKQSRHPRPFDGAKVTRTGRQPDESTAEQILVLAEEFEAAEIVDTDHLEYVPGAELKRWGQRHLFATNSNSDVKPTVEVGQDNADAVRDDDLNDTNIADIGEDGSSSSDSGEDDSTDHNDDTPLPEPVPIPRQLQQFRNTLCDLFGQGGDIVRQTLSNLSPQYLFTDYIIDRATQQTNHPTSSLLADLILVALILPFIICGEAIRRIVIAIRSWFNAPQLTRWIHFLLAAWFLYFAYTVSHIHEEWFVANTSNMRERVFAWREEHWDSSVLEHVRWYSQRRIERQFYRDEYLILT